MQLGDCVCVCVCVCVHKSIQKYLHYIEIFIYSRILVVCAVCSNTQTYPNISPFVLVLQKVFRKYLFGKIWNSCPLLVLPRRQ
jgi:hypothetical protein